MLGRLVLLVVVEVDQQLAQVLDILVHGDDAVLELGQEVAVQQKEAVAGLVVLQGRTDGLAGAAEVEFSPRAVLREPKSGQPVRAAGTAATATDRRTPRLSSYLAVMPGTVQVTPQELRKSLLGPRTVRQELTRTPTHPYPHRGPAECGRVFLVSRGCVAYTMSTPKTQADRVKSVGGSAHEPGLFPLYRAAAAGADSRTGTLGHGPASFPGLLHDGRTAKGKAGHPHFPFPVFKRTPACV
ncbi:hypothetical protein GCM10022625_43270 [Deinococcus aetherius]